MDHLEMASDWRNEADAGVPLQYICSVPFLSVCLCLRTTMKKKSAFSFTFFFSSCPPPPHPPSYLFLISIRTVKIIANQEIFKTGRTSATGQP